MPRFWMTAIIAMTVAGCTGQNTALNRLQFSNETMPFPQNYQAEAARVLADAEVGIAGAQVSYPQQTLGASAFGSKRWYSCIHVQQESATAPSGLPNLEDAFRLWTGGYRGERYTLLFFSAEGRRPSVRNGVDSPLCRDARFEQITAAPPVV